jgi:tRNA-uridine 2-sulfurtransferase
MTGKKQRVVVAMSGGVDSSVAAALLVEAGYDVIGIMLKLWNEPGQECVNRCCTPDSMALARRVAAKIGIPFYSIDAKQTFYDQVVRYFMDGYLNGKTPNPCGVCNQFIRWDFLLTRALSLEANYLATGHYVHLTQSGKGLYSLLQALDHQKDQSYILYTLTQEQLSHALFPLGQFKKTEVREIAQSLNLPVADKPESQDLCFLGNGSIKDFIIRQSGQLIEPGPIKDITGNKIGEHQGLPFYTIGQRKGLGISSTIPLYVLKKEIKGNTIIVGPKTSLGQTELLASHLNWISGIPPQTPFIADVKIRYKAQLIKTTTIPLPSGDVRVEFPSPLRDITPGQVVVFYNKEECLGGGIIQ